MSDVSTFIAFAAGALMGAVIMGVFMGQLVHNHYESYKEQKARVFALEQHIIHLENETYPEHWILQAEGYADPVVVRGRPDLLRSLDTLDTEAEWVEPGLKSHPSGSEQRVIKIESELEEDDYAGDME